MHETDISSIIIKEYHEKLIKNLNNDVVIVGSGPAGLTAAYYLGKSGIKTVVIEKRLSIGGGIWGGASGYNEIVVEKNNILKEIGVGTKKKKGMYVANAVEFASALGFRASRAAGIMNLTEFDDIIFKDNIVKGIVVISTAIKIAGLHVDPFCIGSKCIIDATGHSAEVINVLKRKIKDFHPEILSEGPMDAKTGEYKVVERTGEVYPGVYAAGMSVSAAYNTPRMGPIFGGMLESGKKVAQMIKEKLKK